MKVKCILSNSPEFTIEMLIEEDLDPDAEYVLKYPKSESECPIWGMSLGEMMWITMGSIFKISKERISKDNKVVHLRRWAGKDVPRRGQVYKLGVHESYEGEGK